MSEVAIPSLSECRLIDVVELAGLTGLSKPTLWRHHEAGLIPAGCKIGRAVRWRLRTGDPRTGILDWLDAGCPSRTDAASSSGTDTRSMECELCASGEPVEVFDLPTLYGPRSVCRDRLQRYGRPPPLKQT